jgi:hypothetical protein
MGRKSKFIFRYTWVNAIIISTMYFPHFPNALYPILDNENVLSLSAHSEIEISQYIVKITTNVRLPKENSHPPFKNPRGRKRKLATK